MTEIWKLSNGVEVPAIGFGVGSSWRVQKATLKLPPDHVMPELVQSVENAIKVGFDHIDGAEIYLTRKELYKGIENSGIDRKNLFLTDKHFCGTAQYPAFTGGPSESIDIFLKDLRTDYIDLYLLHSSQIFYPEGKKQLTNVEQWKQLEKAYKEGKVKAIGVSNYSADDIEKIMVDSEIKPQALQIEFHAMCQNKTPGIFDYCKKHNIQLFAYAPLAPITLSKEKNELNEFLSELAKKYGKTEAQILLRWVTQSGVIPITTSGKHERLKQAKDIFSFKIDEEDYEKIKSLGEKYRKSFYNW